MTWVKDPSSSAKPEECVNKHVDLQWEVDFEASRISGSAIVSLERKPSANQVLLDIDQLDIKAVFCRRAKEDAWAETTFSISPFASFGSCLSVTLPPASESGSEGREELQARIDYSTTPESPSVCWMEPGQTAGKDYRYLFTQGQSVLNRGLFPCQDSPSIRITYSATVTVPAGYTALMSAAATSPPGGEAIKEDGRELRRFSYSMRHPIPSYLVALVVGNLASAEIGPRSVVWTEPAMLEACRKEFEGITERYLAAGEELFGPYLWDRYDLVVMPPGFPFGGMENPTLTFVTPALVVGDRSLTDTIAHEIAHSWYGNLATNGTWGDFFLNEGFTMYAQRRITTVVHGEAYTHLEALTGLQLLKTEIDNLGATSPLTRLRVPIENGEDPEDTYTDIPYEKGYALVCYLRHLVGSDQEFDAWLKAYVAAFAFQTVMAEDMFNHFLKHFPHLAEQGVDKRPGFEFDKVWLHSPGFPPFFPELNAATALTDPADTLVQELKSGHGRATNAIDGWPTYQKAYLLDKLLEDEAAFKTEGGRRTLTEMAERWGVGNSNNGEVAMRWSLLVIKNGLDDSLPQGISLPWSVERFMQSTGRQKTTLAIYRALMKAPEQAFKDFAQRVFAACKPNLHSNVVKYVTRILSGQDDDSG